MGPGFFPVVMGLSLMLLSGIDMIKTGTHGSWPISRYHLYLALVMAGQAMLLSKIGLVPVVALGMMLLVDSSVSFIKRVVIAMVTAAIMTGIFIGILDLPLILWTWSWM
jgi:hypothetical protein